MTWQTMEQNGLTNSLLLPLQSRRWESFRCGTVYYYSLTFTHITVVPLIVTGCNTPLFLTRVESKDLVVHWEKQK